MKLAVGILLAALTVQPLNLVKPNFDYKVTGANQEVSIPWDASYKCEIAASGISTNKGDALIGSLNLKKGDKIKFETYTAPTQQSIMGNVLICNGGRSSSIYVNGTKQCTVAGESCLVPATVPRGITSVYAYNSDNVSASIRQVHWHSGNTTTGGACYRTLVYHTHTTACYGHYDVPDGYYCTICGEGTCVCDSDDDSRFAPEDDEDDDPVLVCGLTETSVTGYRFSCSYSDGQVLNTVIPAKSNDYNPNCWTKRADINTGSGYGYIQLNPVNKLYLNNSLPRSVFFNKYQYNVVINNNTVVYCKHGNLN